ncbi:phosphoadenylyl-sulfate reductase [soil metagenome]
MANYLPQTIESPGPVDAARVESAREVLRAAAAAAPAVFSTSYGAEDMVLLDLISRDGLPIGVFTLDTGRLPEATYALMHEVEQRYGRIVTTAFPDAAAVAALVARNGINGFYESVENRRECCGVRKREPLERMLRGRSAWVTGLRSDQSVTRTDTPAVEFDAEHALHKYNPLHDWSERDVWAYLRANDVPYNALHDQGWPSIGCAPCSRAIMPGEDIRAGRWWWEDAQFKECGLHPIKLHAAA